MGNVEKINPAEVLFIIFLEIFPISKHTFFHFTAPLPLECATHLVPEKNIFVELLILKTKLIYIFLHSVPAEFI